MVDNKVLDTLKQGRKVGKNTGGTDESKGN